MDYKIDNLLVTGNGFDLDLGLRSLYSQFVESNLWNLMSIKRKKDNPYFSLLDYIEKQHKEDNWFDLEVSMLDYVLSDDKTLVHNVEEDKKDYDAICNTLVDYLSMCFWGTNNVRNASIMMNSCAGDFLFKYFNPLFDNGRNVLCTFNYTPIEIIYSIVGGIPTNARYYHIHGEIKERDFINKKYDGSSIILGIMTEKEISDYSFMLKSNHHGYCLAKFEYYLLAAKNVYIFGHSLNQIDFPYFSNYFKKLDFGNVYSNLTIITKNQESKKCILNNIGNSGININNILSHVKIDFIFTEN